LIGPVPELTTLPPDEEPPPALPDEPPELSLLEFPGVDVTAPPALPFPDVEGAFPPGFPFTGVPPGVPEFGVHTPQVISQ
jgi:hypothetical protein